MARTLTVAAIQIAAHDRTAFADAWPRFASAIGEAGKAGAQLIVLPEATLPGYVLGYEPFDESEIAAGIQSCRALAQEYGAVIVAGAARREQGRVYNSALVIDADGSMKGAADKRFLWHFDRQWFAPGERVEPIATAAGIIGALVCADGRIPTIASTLVDRGAELLVMPTAWVTSGRDPAHLENVQADLLARVRARENGVPFIAANKCGTELGYVAYCGKSQIVHADGTIAQMAAQDEAKTLLAEIEIGGGTPSRCALPAPSAMESRASAMRIAISPYETADDSERMLRILEAQYLIDSQRCTGENTGVLPPRLRDEHIFDPRYLARARLDGQILVIWETACEPAWQVTFARARALELRMYVIVIDRALARAYAVDPEGAIICGTFDGYRVASFTFDPARTEQTTVAPGTDVLDGLKSMQRYASI